MLAVFFYENTLPVEGIELWYTLWTMDEQIPQESKSNNTVIISVVSIIITALVVGGGVFAYQQNSIKNLTLMIATQDEEIVGQQDNLEIVEYYEELDEKYPRGEVVHLGADFKTKPVVLDLTQWNYYIDIEYGISFLYPWNWSVNRDLLFGARPVLILDDPLKENDDYRIEMNRAKTIGDAESILKHTYDNKYDEKGEKIPITLTPFNSTVAYKTTDTRESGCKQNVLVTAEGSSFFILPDPECWNDPVLDLLLSTVSLHDPVNFFSADSATWKLFDSDFVTFRYPIHFRIHTRGGGRNGLSESISITNTYLSDLRGVDNPATYIGFRDNQAYKIDVSKNLEEEAAKYIANNPVKDKNFNALDSKLVSSEWIKIENHSDDILKQVIAYDELIMTYYFTKTHVFSLSPTNQINTEIIEELLSTFIKKG